MNLVRVASIRLLMRLRRCIFISLIIFCTQVTNVQLFNNDVLRFLKICQIVGAHFCKILLKLNYRIVIPRFFSKRSVDYSSDISQIWFQSIFNDYLTFSNKAMFTDKFTMFCKRFASLK